MRLTARFTAAFVLAACGSAVLSAQQMKSPAARGTMDSVASPSVLAPTQHAPFPRELDQLWMAPQRGAESTRTANLASFNASALIKNGEYTKALATATQPGAQQGPLGQYAAYYAGVAQLNLGRAAEARKIFKQLREQKPLGYLAEGAAFGEADAAVALHEPNQAVEIYEKVLKGTPSSIDATLMRLGRAYKAAGDSTKAAEAFARVYYEFALGDLASEASTELSLIGNLQPITPGSQRFKLEMGRAERLFGAGQYGPARESFLDVRDAARGDDREVVDLRLAESNYFLKRYRDAREAMRPLSVTATRRAEALYFFGLASREAGDRATFLQICRRLVDEYPKESWAEDALNALGTHYIKTNEDDAADLAFRELYERFPRGNYAERAAWKAGWRAYRDQNYGDTVKFFEQAAADFPRSDYRPSWLYWAARAHEAMKHTAEADARYAIVLADYQNSYYGRLAINRLGARAEALKTRVAADRSASDDVTLAAPLPPNGPVVRALLQAEMYDDALNELRFARRVWGDSPAIQATVAWTNQQLSRGETGMARFQLVRGAMTTMKRAYPQFLASGGEELPRDVQTVIFPVAYWDLIRKNAAANQLDPYLVAALVAQESTFVADIRSHANAYGLTQLLPSTARQYAKKVGIPYTTRVLTDPEANLRIGTKYFADLVDELGDVHLALASYNAGTRPVKQWLAERPGVPRDEFIDDIPYPETQGYVRKILGTADDYRRLYGDNGTPYDGLDKTPPMPGAKAVAPASPAPKAKSATSSKAKPKPKVTPSPKAKKPAAKSTAKSATSKR